MPLVPLDNCIDVLTFNIVGNSYEIHISFLESTLLTRTILLAHTIYGPRTKRIAVCDQSLEVSYATSDILQVTPVAPVYLAMEFYDQYDCILLSEAYLSKHHGHFG